MDHTASTMPPRQITGEEEGERVWGPIRAEATLHPPAVGFLSTFLAKPELPVKAPFFQWFTSLNLTPDFFDRAIRPLPHSKSERALTVLWGGRQQVGTSMREMFRQPPAAQLLELKLQVAS